MTHLDKLDRELGARYAMATRKSYLIQARGFLRVAGEKPTYTRDDIMHYVNGLVLAGKARNSIHTAIVGIQALCRAIECPWPVTDRMHLPREDDDGLGPVLEPSEVATLIAAARFAKDVPQRVVCLATIYGFRVSEISRILAAGINEPHLLVTTSKSRKKREHGIPGVIYDQLRCPPIAIGEAALHKLFKRFFFAYVRTPRKGEGWHAVRRALVTGLATNEVSDRLLVRFFGWSRTGSAGVVIADRYNRMKYTEVDELVFRRHPFLREWTET